MSFIQLPFGVTEKDDKEKLNLPKSYKKQALFSQLPHLANLDDPIFQSEVQDIISNREDLQNYLLASGNLNNIIQECLNLVVSNGHLNDGTAVRHE